MLKKIVSVAIAAAITINMLLFAVAEEPMAPAFFVVPGSAQVYAGGVVTVDVSIQNNPGITAVKLIVDSEDDVFSLVDAIPLVENVSDEANLDESMVAFATDETLAGDAAYFRLTLRAAGDLLIPPEEVLTKTVTIFTDDATDGEGGDISIESGTAALNVVPYIWGDANLNGKTTLGDAVLALRYAAGYVTNTKIINTYAADVDGFSGVNVADAILILRYVAGVYDPQ